MKFDDAGAFFKELTLHYRLPASMTVFIDGSVRIQISRHGIIEQLQDEIQKAAVQRGFEDASDPNWLTFLA